MRRTRGEDPGDGVLNDNAIAGSNAERREGALIDFRMGLRVPHVVAAEDCTEQVGASVCAEKKLDACARTRACQSQCVHRSELFEYGHTIGDNGVIRGKLRPRKLAFFSGESGNSRRRDCEGRFAQHGFEDFGRSPSGVIGIVEIADAQRPQYLFESGPVTRGGVEKNAVEIKHDARSPARLYQTLIVRQRTGRTSLFGCLPGDDNRLTDGVSERYAA